jgi:squalene monooxygenase
LTIIADGYGSKFRKLHVDEVKPAKSKFHGLELIDTTLPRPYHGHVILGDFPPVLLYQIGTHETRILVDIPTNCPTALSAVGGVKGHMRNVVLPILPKSIKPSFERALDEGQTIYSMPNSWLPPKTNRIPGILFVGDALNMRHPLTGGGMTVAFNDAVLLADLLSPANVPNLDDTKVVLKQLKSFHWQRKDITSVINILAQALYSLFAANGMFAFNFWPLFYSLNKHIDANLRALQRGCFGYFQLGGNCVDGPCGLLAGIIRNPLVLVSHFFSVALYAIWIDACAYPYVLLPFTLLWRGVSLLWTAIVVIVPYIWAELRS